MYTVYEAHRMVQQAAILFELGANEVQSFECVGFKDVIMEPPSRATCPTISMSSMSHFAGKT